MNIMQHRWTYWQWKLTCVAEGGSTRLVEKDLQTLTVQKLKTMLKEKGLPLKGIKVHLHGMGPAGQIWFYIELISVAVEPTMEWMKLSKVHILLHLRVWIMPKSGLFHCPFKLDDLCVFECTVRLISALCTACIRIKLHYQESVYVIHLYHIFPQYFRPILKIWM